MVFALCLALAGAGLSAEAPAVGSRDKAGLLVATGQRVAPAGEVLTFAGRAVALGLSPDQGTLFVKASSGLLVVDARAWRVRQVLAWTGGDSASMQGLAVDGAGRVWVTTGKSGALLEAVLDGKGRWAWGRRLAMPSRDQGSAYPCGVVLVEGGRRALVALGRNNTLARVDLGSGTVLQETPVGVAPCGLALSADGHRALVANWGGRRPRAGQRTMASSGTPCCTRKSLVTMARFSESCWLKASVPVLSV